MKKNFVQIESTVKSKKDGFEFFLLFKTPSVLKVHVAHNNQEV